MSLLAYNKTTAPLALAAGNLPVTLPIASSTGAHGPAVDVTAQLKGLTEVQYTALMAQVFSDLCVFEWSNKIEEYDTGSLLVGLENQAFYVDPTLGNDLNPGTQAQPFQTLEAAFDAIAGLGGEHRGRLRIFLAAGNFPVDTGRQYDLSSSSGHWATPLLIVGTPTDELGTLIASVGDANALQFTVAGAVPGAADDYFGATILCTGGVNVGMRRLCVANTAGAGPNTFTVNEQFYFGPISPGDTFVVQRPASIIQPSAGGLLNLTEVLLIGMKYVAIDGQNAAGIGFFGSSGFITSCEFRNCFTFVEFGATLFPSGSGNPWAVEGDDNPIGGLFFTSFPAGAYFNSCPAVQFGSKSSMELDSYLCVKDTAIIAADDCRLGGNAIFQKNSSMICYEGIAAHNGAANVDLNTFTPLVSPGEATCVGTAGLPGVGAWHVVNGSLLRFNGIKLEGSPIDAVTTHDAAVELGFSGNSGPGFEYRPWVIGSTAAGVGASLQNGGELNSKILLQATGGAASTTATGFSGLAGANADAAFNVGDLIEISGAAVGGNNGVFTITNVISPTQVDTSPAPTSPDGNDGALGWTIWNAPHLSGVSGDLRLGGRLDPNGTQVGGVVKTYADAATVDPVDQSRSTNVKNNYAGAIEFNA